MESVSKPYFLFAILWEMDYTGFILIEVHF
jgi:hypothetical protein